MIHTFMVETAKQLRYGLALQQLHVGLGMRLKDIFLAVIMAMSVAFILIQG